MRSISPYYVVYQEDRLKIMVIRDNRYGNNTMKLNGISVITVKDNKLPGFVIGSILLNLIKV